MKVTFQGTIYDFDQNKHQRVELHQGWDQYGNGSISLYGSITPYTVLKSANYDMKNAVLVKLNQDRIVNLHTALDADCMMEVITYQDERGKQTVKDSLELIICALLKGMQAECEFQIICNDAEIEINFLQDINTSALAEKLREAIQQDLKLRKLLMQADSAREILQYTGNTEEYEKLRMVDEDEILMLCQFQKYYGLAKEHYIDSSGWFHFYRIQPYPEKNSIVLEEV